MSSLNAELHVPRLNTTAIENPQEFFDCLIDRCKEQISVMLPCKVLKYDRATHLADLRVLFNWKMADGGVMDGCTIYNITIRRLLAGNFIIDFPISVGDTGWIFACDRDAYDSKAEGEPRLPPTPYCNSYASGFWLPDQWGSNTKLEISGIDSAESGRLVIEHKNGTQKISVGSGDIKVYATDLTTNITNNKNVTVGVKTTVTSPTIEISASTKTTLTSPSIKLVGDVEIDGALKVSGLITANGDLKDSNGTTFSTHKHPTAATGSPSSPTPGT